MPLKAPRPPGWTHASAAALPTVYTTVDVALSELAGLRRGERVLVHAAAGGVGLTAVQYAQRLGATVYATAGREEKREHLRSLGVRHIASSRKGDEFEAEMGELLGGEQVDVVLNSLSHEGFIGRSLKFLRSGGRFVEIGKRNVWTPEQVVEARPDVRYYLLAIDAICQEEPERYQGLLQRLARRMREGWEPLRAQAFDGLERGAEALQVLRHAQNIGKVVLTVPSGLGLCEDAAYVLSGGTGGLGLAAARAMVEDGARSLVLLSRGGRPAQAARAQWEWLQACGAEVMSWTCDLASAEGDDAGAADLVEVHAKEAVGEAELSVWVPASATFMDVKRAIAARTGADEVVERGRLLRKRAGVYAAHRDADALGDVRSVLVLGASLLAADEAAGDAAASAGAVDAPSPSQALAARLHAELQAPVRGALHLAGVLDDVRSPGSRARI